MTETKKLYYSISEVSKRLGVKPHVLRYWETQFRWLRPKKNRAGNRSYQEKDLFLLEQIRELLYDRRFTIEGARKEIDRIRAGGAPSTGDGDAPSGEVPSGDAPSGGGRAAAARSASDASDSVAAPAGTGGETGKAGDPAETGARAGGSTVRDGGAPSGGAPGSGNSGTQAAAAVSGTSDGVGSTGTPHVVVQTELRTGADPKQIGELRAELLGLKEWLESRS
ncbi:MAG: MerR family transcriptional regulator [Candidatus Eisenbacteria bacterium]